MQPEKARFLISVMVEGSEMEVKRPQSLNADALKMVMLVSLYSHGTTTDTAEVSQSLTKMPEIVRAFREVCHGFDEAEHE